MIFYKGDLIQRKKDKNGNPIDVLWGTEIIGVITKFESHEYVIFHRPLKTKITLKIKKFFK